MLLTCALLDVQIAPSAGCQPVEWAGKGGFTHLLHHPGFVKTETYGSARAWGACA